MPEPATDHTREITVDSAAVPIPRAVIDQTDTPPAPPAVSVWATAQHAPATQ